MAQKPQGLHPEDIKSRIRKKFGTLSALGVHLKRSPNTISNAIYQPGYSVPLERQIADAIGMEPYEVFPDRFHNDGSPVRVRADRTPTCPLPDAHRQNGAAA
ncbi:helix-turn-helix domain-containing protein [Komagataeibacter oboediens]|uniref:Transcriptional regulator n=1 Tax=Komagataeibacter oboediens TaxID=65958 RepID=A0ABS5SQY8_9PROT|nr:helix-turn-helix domain-containing protein [Komagataeibacter oboediens]MBL7232088.1 helix-turn-helix domain-containing protein [Komagataeibacter oboediens]MBT0676633.1 transcriptional regulator [Komagataeibacter oboediens]MBT0679930.1 transcriptional regulator [Komagataeibacter oboediens]